MSLHYFTDATQPMHAANYTFLDSSPLLGYHTDFESYVMEQQSTVSAPSTYAAGNDQADPGEYLIAAATNALNNYFPKIDPSNVTPPGNYYGIQPLEKAIDSILQPMLQDAINLTSQYLVAWMTIADNELASRVMVCAGSGLLVDVPRGSKHPGVQLQQYPWNNSRPQKFSFIPLSGADAGFYKISCQPAALVLDVSGNEVIQQIWADTPTQKWQLTPDPTTGMMMLTNTGGNVLTVPGAATAKRTRLMVAPDQGGPGQRWIVSPSTVVNITPEGSTGIAVDVKGGAEKQGTPLWLYREKNSPAQCFLWVPLQGADAGYYAILAQCSGLALFPTVTGNNVNIEQLPWNLGDASMKRSRVPVSPDSAGFYIANQSEGYIVAPALTKKTFLIWNNSPSTEWEVPLNSASRPARHPHFYRAAVNRSRKAHGATRKTKSTVGHLQLGV